MLQGIRMENGNFVLDGYPEGATVHGIEGPAAKELRRLAVFRGELQSVVRWLSLIPGDVPQDASNQAFAFVGLADAALLGFCRCFDLDHALKPLKKKKMLSLDQRDELERLQNIRNKLVAHDNQLFNGVFSLIVRSTDLTAIEAVSINLVTPFVVHSELKALRTLSQFVLDWLKQEHRESRKRNCADFQHYASYLSSCRASFHDQC